MPTNQPSGPSRSRNHVFDAMNYMAPLVHKWATYSWPVQISEAFGAPSATYARIRSMMPDKIQACDEYVLTEITTLGRRANLFSCHCENKTIEVSYRS